MAQHPAPRHQHPGDGPPGPTKWYATDPGRALDEIQRNIIGERALGLPREPSSDRDVPFRDLPRNG